MTIVNIHEIGAVVLDEYVPVINQYMALGVTVLGESEEAIQIITDRTDMMLIVAILNVMREKNLPLEPAIVRDVAIYVCQEVMYSIEG